MKRTNRAAWSIVVLAVVIIGGVMTVHAMTGKGAGTNGTATGNAVTKTNTTTPGANRTSVTTPPKPKVSPAAINLPSLKSSTIIAVGGSVGKGWNDFPSGSTKSPIGYLVRGMNIVEQESGIPYTFINESVGGWGPLQMASRFSSLLTKDHPKVVIISWGLLDDMAKKTPHTEFENAVRTEISKSLAAGATVWVVTPPATGASVAPGSSTRQWSYAVDELNAAKSFPSSKVVVFDLLSAEKNYLAVHHISVTSLDANGWHPNTPGHILAAQLMAQLIMHANPSTATIAKNGWFVGSKIITGLHAPVLSSASSTGTATGAASTGNSAG